MIYKISLQFGSDGVCVCLVVCVHMVQFGFRKWKSHVTERPIEDRSDIVRELYSELNFVRPQG